MNKTQQRIRVALLAFVTIALSIMGMAKLISSPHEIEAFVRWGYPLWFMYFIGASEVLGAIGINIPKVSRYAAGGLVIILMGAIMTHAINKESLLAPIPATILLLMVLGIIFLSHLKPKVTA